MPVGKSGKDLKEISCTFYVQGTKRRRKREAEEEMGCNIDISSKDNPQLKVIINRQIGTVYIDK